MKIEIDTETGYVEITTPDAVQCTSAAPAAAKTPTLEEDMASARRISAFLDRLEPLIERLCGEGVLPRKTAKPAVGMPSPLPPSEPFDPPAMIDVQVGQEWIAKNGNVRFTIKALDGENVAIEYDGDYGLSSTLRSNFGPNGIFTRIYREGEEV